MDIIDVINEILLIPAGMLPITPLPDFLFAFRLSALVCDYGAVGEFSGHIALDQPQTGGINAIILGYFLYHVDMVGQIYKRNHNKRMSFLHIADCFFEQGDGKLILKIGEALVGDKCKEKSSTRQNGSAKFHEIMVSEIF
jgi:hypothetical protein